MRARCVVEVEFADSKAPDAALKSVSHEAGAGNRSRARLTRKERTLMLDIEAEDVTALRAAVNAFLRAMQVFEGVDNAAEVQK